jgi:hypothetical protein
MLTNRRLLSLIVLGFALLLLAPTSTMAQDATPAPTDCPPATVEENVALVEELHAAVDSADADAIDRILADDYAHNQNRYGLPDDPTSNDDEINLALRLQEFYANSSRELTDIFGVDNKVVVESVWTITEHAFTGETVVLDTPIEVRSIAIFTVECGEVVALNTVADELTLLVGLGVYPPLPIMQATPAS